TSSKRDWSSDVCSSDLGGGGDGADRDGRRWRWLGPNPGGNVRAGGAQAGSGSAAHRPLYRPVEVPGNLRPDGPNGRRRRVDAVGPTGRGPRSVRIGWG